MVLLFAVAVATAADSSISSSLSSSSSSVVPIQYQVLEKKQLTIDRLLEDNKDKIINIPRLSLQGTGLLDPVDPIRGANDWRQSQQRVISNVQATEYCAFRIIEDPIKKTHSAYYAPYSSSSTFIDAERRISKVVLNVQGNKPLITSGSKLSESLLSFIKEKHPATELIPIAIEKKQKQLEKQARKAEQRASKRR